MLPLCSFSSGQWRSREGLKARESHLTSSERLEYQPCSHSYLMQLISLAIQQGHVNGIVRSLPSTHHLQVVWGFYFWGRDGKKPSIFLFIKNTLSRNNKQADGYFEFKQIELLNWQLGKLYWTISGHKTNWCSHNTVLTLYLQS